MQISPLLPDTSVSREVTPNHALIANYSHTFENRSSPPPKPPAGLLCCDDAFDDMFLAGAVGTAGVTGAALFQPPKSSSAAIFGGA